MLEHLLVHHSSLPFPLTSILGETALPYLPNNMTPLMKDYTTEQVQIEDVLKNIDPLNYPKQEAALLELGHLPLSLNPLSPLFLSLS